MSYHNNDPAWQANRLREINADANTRMLETAHQLIESANFYPCNGAQPDDRTVSLHDAAAVARAALTWKSEYAAWRKRAEEAESALTQERERIEMLAGRWDGIGNDASADVGADLDVQRRNDGYAQGLRVAATELRAALRESAK